MYTATFPLQFPSVFNFFYRYIWAFLRNFPLSGNSVEETARQEEKKMIAADAQVGHIWNVEVLSKIKTNLERSDNPEATSSMRKSKALSQAL